jgi:hypothetical protein
MVGRPRIVTTAFYLACIVIAVAMSGITHYVNTRPFVVAQAPDQNTALSKSLDAYMAMNNLLTTLTTGLLAGLGLFLTGRPKKNYPVGDLWPAALCAVCACVSLYWGYVSSQNVEWAIETIGENLGLDQIQLPRQLQCFTMLLSVIFFADFVRRDLTKVD